MAPVGARLKSVVGFCCFVFFFNLFIFWPQRGNSVAEITAGCWGALGICDPPPPPVGLSAVVSGRSLSY